MHTQQCGPNEYKMLLLLSVGLIPLSCLLVLVISHPWPLVIQRIIGVHIQSHTISQRVLPMAGIIHTLREQVDHIHNNSVYQLQPCLYPPILIVVISVFIMVDLL